MRINRLWFIFIAVLVASFAVLGHYGREIYHLAPPIPGRVVTTDGQSVFTGQDIQTGQNVWQSIGGHELGSIWGHGAYVAPDWSADWLHRELTATLAIWAKDQGSASFDGLPEGQKAPLLERLRQETRRNTYDSASDTLTISKERAAAIAQTAAHYTALFGDDPALDALRQAYAMPSMTIKDPERQKAMNAFFFWAAWTCATERPGEQVTYTNNWPPEPLIANQPSSNLLVWSILSFIFLLAGVGGMVWFNASLKSAAPEEHIAPEQNPLAGLQLTPSMKATLKYFWVVVAVFLVQILVGVLTAHYSVEGQGLFGIPLAKWLPYSLVRTWHVQTGIFWIATAWLATGLFVAPAVAGREPAFQRLGVNILFIALLIVVAGSMTGEWFSIQQKMSLTNSFWFGHQGYEYVDLGRFWQILLFAGLLIWLFLVGRALIPALWNGSESKSLLGMFIISAVAIGGFYGAGLMWGQHTHLSMVEYWRWWVVHLWVEGFFEVFATAVIAYLLSKLQLVRTNTAAWAVVFASITYVTGGIIGTMHHLYFTGTPTAVLAWGAMFSALEIVPLVLVGFEACENYRISRARPWVEEFKWPIYFFIAVAFWNLVGAGLFGFLINPPIALYYMQGLNTTPVHGHTALYGVYGMLGIGLMLFCLKGFSMNRRWRTGSLRLAFWAINIGLLLMVLISLLPVGILQTLASIDKGMWWARSADFLQQPEMQYLRWLRAIGDTIFSVGAVALAWFVAGLATGHSLEKE